MSSAALVTKNDLPLTDNYSSILGDFIVNNPFRVMGLWVDSASAFGKSLNTTSSVLSGLYAIQEIITIPESLGDGWKAVVKKICSLVVSVGCFLETPGLSNSLKSLGGRISPFVPICDAAYYGFAFFENLSVVRAQVLGDESHQKIAASNLKKSHHKWELVKNGILGGAVAVCAAGVNLSPPLLLAVALSAFGSGMVAHFKKSEMIRYSIENNVI